VADIPLFVIAASSVLLAWIVFTFIIWTANYRPKFSLRALWFFITCICVVIAMAISLGQTVGYDK
jgi:hypothetical protein